MKGKKNSSTNTLSKVVNPTFAQKEKFLQDIAGKNEKVVALSLFEKFQTPFVSNQPLKPQAKLPPSLRSLYREELSNVSPDVLKQECLKIFKYLSYEMHELIFVEESTRNQNKSSIWYEQRIGRITGSIAHQASSTISASLTRRICQSQCQPINSAALKWGREHETVALNYYKSVMLDTCLPSKPKLIGNFRKHVNFECANIGLVIDNEYPCLGASPDAKFNCSCCNFGVVEIKCPYSLRDSMLSQVIHDKEKEFYITYESGMYTLNKKHQYFTQVQLEMRVTETNVCNFVVWTPHETLILEVKGDKEFQDTLCTSLVKNWVDHILPELVTRNLEKNSNQLVVQTVSSDNKKYCFCKTTVTEGEMVGCDICDDWFHSACLKLSMLPTSKVCYCPMCKKPKKQKLDKKDE